MAYIKRAGSVSKLEYLVTAPDTWGTIDGVKSITYPRGSKPQIDATTIGPDVTRRSFLDGLADAPSFDVPILWDDKTSDAVLSHRAIETAFKTNTSMTLRLTTPDSRTYQVAVNVVGQSLSCSVDEAYTNTVTFKPTGEETVGDAS